MAKSKEFETWRKLETARRLGQQQEINKLVNDQLLDKDLKIEYY